MFGDVLRFFQSQMTAHFKMSGVAEARITFPAAANGQQEAIDFENDALNIMMVNLEEEKINQKADRYIQASKGKSFPAFPEIRLNMYLLFVANRSDYITSCDMLSLVVQFFQANRLFVPDNTPDLPIGIQKLTAELITLPFAQQNEVWSSLRTSYKPSVLYKVRMVVFRSENPLMDGPKVETIKRTLNN